MTPARIAEIRARLAAATPGPWRAEKSGPRNFGDGTPVYLVVVDDGTYACDTVDGQNAALIAAAPTDIADLLAEVERLQQLARQLIADDFFGHERKVEAARAEVERLTGELARVRTDLAEATRILGEDAEFCATCGGTGEVATVDQNGSGEYVRCEACTEPGRADWFEVDPPVDMLLFCPRCLAQHIDAPHGDLTNPPHRSHECQACHHVWRPADVATNGVAAIVGQVDGSADPRTAERAAEARVVEAAVAWRETAGIHGLDTINDLAHDDLRTAVDALRHAREVAGG